MFRTYNNLTNKIKKIVTKLEADPEIAHIIIQVVSTATEKSNNIFLNSEDINHFMQTLETVDGLYIANDKSSL